MKRVGFILKVKENHLDEYKKYHRDVWPEMKSALKNNGWKKHINSVHNGQKDHRCDSCEKSFSDSLAGMSKEEVNERWQKLMAPFFEIPEGAAPDQSMIEIEEVFHLD